ncbi:hypothetical protein [Alteraurantiacibacter aquimixticola]|uniref:Tetratricopeptide repeat protein n=1 Tax=Alteraurantiacibacter aquimixticola TaxID=2489173 RepID=A0A4T3F3N3_9SPHN|nr:hypothetical protein [Alteraurantiacibacter aquimixticola]TIX50118.1 hypothetical protein E5222_07415 [Alteraurantiacibacter aquimixticola]
MFRSTRGNSTKGFISACAMAIALAGGAAVATGAAPATVQAQDYSDAFIDAYQPVADVVNAEGGDVASVVPQLDTIVSLAQNADEKYAAGNLILIAGNKTGEQPMQRRGLEIMLESGKVPVENVAQFQWFVGNIAFNEGDYMASRAALSAAVASGWNQDDPVGLIAETYWQSDDAVGGLAYLQEQIPGVLAAGGQVDSNWILRGLVTAYDAENFDASVDATAMLVKANPVQQSWLNGLQVVNALGEFEGDVRIDLLRLMRLTDTMTQSQEFIRYIAAADPRVYSNEISGVLARGLADGHFETDDPYYQEVKSTVDRAMAGDRAEAPSLVSEAEADANGESAMIAGNVLMTLEDWSGAEAMFAMAAEKGGVDTNLATLRTGMMQVHQGKVAEAQQTLAGVTGERAAIARLWSTYAEVNGG